MTNCEVARRRRPVWPWVFGLIMLMPSLALAGAQNVQPKHNEGVVAVDPTLCDDMKLHHVLPSESPVGCERLKLVRFGYFGFDGRLYDNGEIIVLDAVADHVLNIFRGLRKMRFPIAKAILMNHYDGNDDRSMADNNTSAFNVRNITRESTISMHSYGLAIDINPVQNPYAKPFGASLQFNPPAGVEYANRLDDRPGRGRRPGMAEAVVDVFANDGFLVWGGYWNDPIDYQHFQVTPKLAEPLVRLKPAKATATFENYVQKYRKCLRSARDPAPLNRINCIMAVNADDKPSGE